MGKHDQRILKYLDQNRDRGPTITEMMTKLSISISEISDALIALESAGWVTKRTNSHDIECWFPTAAPTTPQVAPSFQSPIATRNPQPVFNHDMSPGSAYSPRPETQAYAPASKPAPIPVPVQHIQAVEPAASQTQTFIAMPAAEPIVKPKKSFVPPKAGSFNQYASMDKGINLLTFAIGLIAVAAFSTWLSSRMVRNEILKSSKTYVNQKGLTNATAAMQDFQIKTKAHITALEEEVKQLRNQLAAVAAAAVPTTESMDDKKQEAGSTPVASKAASDATSKSEKSDKKAKGNKSDSKSEAATAKAKPAKKAPVAKAKSSSAPVKTAAQSTKKQKSSDKVSKSESAGSTPEEENTSTPISYDGPSGEVPAPPGLSDQDLPPPPKE